MKTKYAAISIKIFLILLIMSSGVISSYGQAKSIRKVIEIPDNGSILEFINLNMREGNVEIAGADQDKVVIEAQLFEFLKQDRDPSLFEVGQYSNFDVKVSENGIDINSDSRGNRVDFFITVPKSFDVRIDCPNYETDGKMVIQNVAGYIDVDSYNGQIRVQNIKNGIHADTYNGDIQLQFDNFNERENLIDSYNGSLEIFIPRDANLSFLLYSQEGTVVSEIEGTTSPVELDDQQKEGSVFTVAEGSLFTVNGGGDKVTAKTTTGDIIIKQNMN